MSIELMTLVWKVPFPTSTQMVVALKLADHAEDDGSKIYPGRASLAERARCSESSVKLILKMFREAGILIVVEEGGKGPHDTTRYKMNVGLLQAIAAGEVSISGSSTTLELDWSDDSDSKGSNFDPLGFYPVNGLSLRGQRVVAKGSTHSPQTTKNHQEPSERAGAPATRGAARPSLLVRKGDTTWEPWLAKIEETQGIEARMEVEAAGKIVVPERWPKETTPVPIVDVLQAQIKACAGGRA